MEINVGNILEALSVIETKSVVEFIKLNPFIVMIVSPYIGAHLGETEATTISI